MATCLTINKAQIAFWNDANVAIVFEAVSFHHSVCGKQWIQKPTSFWAAETGLDERLITDVLWSLKFRGFVDLLVNPTELWILVNREVYEERFRLWEGDRDPRHREAGLCWGTSDGDTTQDAVLASG